MRCDAHYIPHLVLVPKSVFPAGLRAHVVQMLHGQEVKVQESVNAVGEARLFRLVKFRTLDVSGDTLLPASLSEVMRLYMKNKITLAHTVNCDGCTWP